MTIILLVAGCLLPMTVLVAAQEEYRAECAVWQNITDSLMQENTVPMNCDKNVQCTGIDCSCEFRYTGLFSAGTAFVEDFCFGVAIHPCKTPLEMHFYVESPNEPAADTYQQTITNGTSFQLPGVHYTMSQFVTADGFVDVTMQEQRYLGYRYVKLGLKYKTRISTPISTSWPDDLSFELLPVTLVPVPPCQNSVVTPTHHPGACQKYSPATTTVKPGSPTAAPTVTPPPPGMNCTVGVASTCKIYEVCKKPDGKNTTAGHCVCTKGYHRVNGLCELHPDFVHKMPDKSCIPRDNEGGCGDQQTCVYKSGESKGLCQCSSGFEWDGTACVSGGTTPTYRIIGEPDYSKYDGGSSKSKIIIPAAVGGVVLIMAIAAAVVVIKYRRYKARYGQHTLLMSEDDDRDDNDAPMVEA